MELREVREPEQGATGNYWLGAGREREMARGDLRGGWQRRVWFKEGACRRSSDERVLSKIFTEGPKSLLNPPFLTYTLWIKNGG